MVAGELSGVKEKRTGSIAKLLVWEENGGGVRLEMGTVIATVEVGDPHRRNFQAVELEVDPGSTYTALPRDLLESLGVRSVASVPARLADGSRQVVDLGQTTIRLGGRQFITRVIFAEKGKPSLLGVITLEDALLAVDPVHNELIPVEAKRY